MRSTLVQPRVIDACTKIAIDMIPEDRENYGCPCLLIKTDFVRAVRKQLAEHVPFGEELEAESLKMFKDDVPLVVVAEQAMRTHHEDIENRWLKEFGGDDFQDTAHPLMQELIASVRTRAGLVYSIDIRFIEPGVTGGKHIPKPGGYMTHGNG